MMSHTVRVIMFALTDVASYLACYKSIVLKQKPESWMAIDTKDAPKHLFADQARTYIPWHLHTQTTSIPQQGTLFCSTSFYFRNVRNSPPNKTKSSRRLPGLKVPQILIWLSYLGRAWKNASHESLLAWGKWGGGWFIWDIFGWVLSGKKNSSTSDCDLFHCYDRSHYPSII